MHDSVHIKVSIRPHRCDLGEMRNLRWAWLLVNLVAVVSQGPPAEDGAVEMGPGIRRATLLQDEEMRFLRGCGGDEACAAARHAKLLSFRDAHPNVYRNLSSGGVADMIRSGAVLLPGTTCAGHAVLLVRNRLFDWSRSQLELLQWQVYNHEVLLRHTPAQGIVVVQDVSQTPLSAMWAVARSGGLGLLNYFDQNVVGIVIVGEPWFFGSFWKVARLLLPERERNMIKLLGNSNWAKLPQAVQMGPDLEGLPCGGGELGEVEKRLLLLPSDDDLDGVRLGTIELEIPMHPMGDAEHPAQLDPWTEEEENGSEEYEHRHSEL